MIDLKKVDVTGDMLLAWQKKTNKDPLTSTNFTIADVLYAYYLMVKTVKKDITEEQAYKEIKSNEIVKVMNVFFPALATPPEDLKSLQKST